MKGDRVLGLDIIRAFAIFSVLIIHTLDLTTTGLNHYLQYVKFDGVIYFFVLSGFLIGNILIKSLEQSVCFNTILNFWLRRWFRTIPNYLLFLVILLFVFGEYKFRIFKYLLFLQNFYKPIPDFFPESWSLTIEEWFYLSLPIVIYILHKVFKWRVKISILFILIFVIMLTPIIRYYMCVYYNVNDLLSWEHFIRGIAICRFDSIIFGVLGAFVSYYYLLLWTSYRKMLFYLGFSGLLIFKLLEINYNHIFFDSQLAYFMSVFYLSIQSLLILFMLPFLSTFNVSSESIITRVIRRISLVSYSLYLINYSLVKGFLLVYMETFLKEYIQRTYLEIILILSFWIISISSSIMIYNYFELPVMKLRDRLTISK